jgi:hypothetical protein
LGIDRVGAHPEDRDTELVEVFFCVTKLGRFNGSTGSVGFGEEKENDALAVKIHEGQVIALIGLELEVGSFGADLQHNDPSLQIQDSANWGAACCASTAKMPQARRPELQPGLG